MGEPSGKDPRNRLSYAAGPDQSDPDSRALAKRTTLEIGAKELMQIDEVGAVVTGGGSGLGNLGFGSEVNQAMQQRAEFLAEQGLAERRGQRVILARNLLATLRDRDVIRAAKDIATETGLEHRLAADGQRVTGIYRRSLMLASGRFAMLDDGMGFSLVPWTPVIEQRLGMLISGQVHGGTLSWQIRRQQGLSVT